MSTFSTEALTLVTEAKGRGAAADAYGRPAVLSFRKAHPDQRGGGWLIVTGAFPLEQDRVVFTPEDARALRDYLNREYPE